MDATPSVVDAVSPTPYSISSTSWFVATAITIHVVHEGFVTPKYFDKVGAQIQNQWEIWLGNTATVVVLLQPFLMLLERMGISRSTPIALLIVGVFHSIADHIVLSTYTSKDGGNACYPKFAWRPASTTALGLVFPVSLYHFYKVFIDKTELQFLTAKEVRNAVLGGLGFVVAVFFGAWDMVVRSRKAASAAAFVGKNKKK